MNELRAVKVVPNSTPLHTPSFHKMFIDVHEPESIVEKLRKEKGIYIEVKSLPVGDYAFSNVCIERKSLPDFYNSIVHGDKRIWRQVFNLKRASERPILIVERWNNSFLSSRRVEKTVYGALARILLMGVNVVIIPGSGRNVSPFVEFLSFLFYSSNKKTLSMKPVPERSKSMRKKDILSDVLCMIPTIGRKLADEIATRVSSIEELCQMSDEDLKRLVPNLGKKRLQMVRWILNGREPPKV